jgi:predicted enzyme related to lactoylglutathione lyase
MAARKNPAGARKARGAARRKGAAAKGAARPKTAARRRAAARSPRAAPAPRAPAARRTPARPTAAAPRAGTRMKTGRGAARPAAPRVAAVSFPSVIGVRMQHMDYTTHVMEDVKRFYTEVLGFKRFDWDENMQYLSGQTGPSSSLGFMSPQPGPPELWRPPREAALYLVVEDLDRAHRELVERGVTFEQDPADMPWGHRVALLRDPEGRTVYLAEIASERGRA